MGKVHLFFYESFYEGLKELDPETRLEFFEAIVEYGLYGYEPEYTGLKTAYWKQIKTSIASAQARYEASVNNGKKGGAPKGNQNARKQPKSTQNNLEQPNSTENNLNDNDNVNNNVNDNKNINDNDNLIHYSSSKMEQNGTPFHINKETENQLNYIFDNAV